MTDDTERAFRDALQARAVDAPRPSTALAGTARRRVVRRRRAGIAGVTAAALAVVLSVVAVAGSDPARRGPAGGDAAPATSGEQTPDADDGLPDGWRWESYGGVEVGVPGDWVHDSGSQMIGQWCVDERNRPSNGFVGRPGLSTAALCPQHPGPTLENVGPYVDFAGITDKPDRPVQVEGDVATQILNGVMLSVQAAEPLRERILDTARAVDVDANGCPTTDPISKDPQLSPTPAVDVTGLTGVQTISACRYVVSASSEYGVGPPPRLISSLHLVGQAARDVVAAIPLGEVDGGPNRPDTCLPEVSWGDEALVLLIESDAGISRVHVGYSGCDHNGFDDGLRTYALTADAIRPLLAGSNTITTGLSGAPADVIWGD